MSSLNAMMTNLELLQTIIDSAEELTPELCNEHFKSIKAIDEKVDRLLSYMDNCKIQSSLYEERARDLKDKAKSFERKLESLEKYCLYLLDSHPDIEWRGTDRKFEKKINQPSLICPLKTSFSTSNYIPDELIYDVPLDFREPKVVWILKTDALKETLKKNSKAVDFARLENKTSLQIKTKLNKDKT